MSAYSSKLQSMQSDWYLVDAKGKTLGRLATLLASRLRGKHKPEFAPYVDVGDHIVVINADAVRVTGNKLNNKLYHHYSGYPGGLKSTPLKKVLEKNPSRVLELAVKGMLPKGPLGRQMFRKLFVYVGAEHPHSAQQPQPLDVI